MAATLCVEWNVGWRDREKGNGALKSVLKRHYSALVPYRPTQAWYMRMYRVTFEMKLFSILDIFSARRVVLRKKWYLQSGEDEVVYAVSSYVVLRRRVNHQQ